MTFKYDIEFHPKAFKEWKKLAPNVREKFKKKLEERRVEPRIPSAKLSGLVDGYKIKLKSDGYR